MKATPFLMFQGQAKDALALYREVFPDYEELLLQEHSEGAQADARSPPVPLPQR